MGYDAFGSAFGPHLFFGLAEGERLCLGEDIRRQDVCGPAAG